MAYFWQVHLSEFMDWKGLTDAQVAQKIGRARVTVSRIRRRKVRPDWATIEALRRWSGGKITADDFINLDNDQAVA